MRRGPYAKVVARNGALPERIRELKAQRDPSFGHKLEKRRCATKGFFNLARRARLEQSRPSAGGIRGIPV
jgi:hypothetical protein